MARAILFLWVFVHFQLFTWGQQVQAACDQELREAAVLLDEDDVVQAQAIFEKWNTQAAVLSTTCTAALSLVRGKMALRKGDFSTAEKDLSLAYRYFSEAEDQIGSTQAAYQLSIAYLENDHREKAIFLLDKLMTEKSIMAEGKLLHKVYDLRAMLYSSEGNHESAMNLLKEAATYARFAQDSASRIQLLNQIATNYQSLGQIDSSLVYYQELIQEKQAVHDRTGLLGDYITLGQLYFDLGHYREAQLNLILAIDQAEALQDTLSLISIYIDIARVYSRERLFGPAMRYAENSGRLANLMHAVLYQGQSLELKANIYEASEQPDSALLMYRKALAVYQQLNFRKRTATIQIRIADLEKDEDQLLAVEHNLREILRQQHDQQDLLGELDTKLALCRVLLKLQRIVPEVENMLIDAQQIAVATNTISGLQEVYRLRSQYNEGKGRFREALFYFRAFKNLQDSLVNQENALVVRELEQRYETEKKDKEIAIQKIALEQQDNTLRRRNILNLLLLISLVFLLGLVALVLFVNRRNKQLNEERLSVLRKERETQILRAMVTGEEKERLRIARDLHDSLGAVVATAKLRVMALADAMPQLKALEGYRKAEELIDDACNNIREISHNMIPGSLNKYGLEEATAQMCEAIEQANDIQIEYIPHGLDQLTDDILETNVYRIIQELLRNIVKHAQATEVIVQLSLEDDLLNITVEDDGCGFEQHQLVHKQGMGIESIQARVRLLRGKLELDSKIGSGTGFYIEIPLKTDNDDDPNTNS